MLDIIVSGVIDLMLNIFQRSPVQIEPMELLAWQHTEIFILPDTNPDLVAEKIVQDYLQALARKGIKPSQQGIWIQSDWHNLVSHNGTQARSAASLTKIATTLAALSTWGVDYQFETKIYAAGEIKDGILQGDLLVEGSHDPFFVWEEAIALGNSLQKLGISKVTGKLIVNDKFYMNYKSRPLLAGNLLLKSLNENLWSAEVSQQYLTLPLGTLRPQIEILGGVAVEEMGRWGDGEMGGKEIVSPGIRLLVTHQSLPLGEILRQMNVYSNNYIAQMLADALGGASRVISIAEETASVSSGDITLINGSGLGEENRIAPRAVCQMLITIDRLLNNNSLAVVDLFPVSGRDLVGTMENRSIPKGTAVKTGTLNRVSALAGVMPTRDRDRIWFAIINGDSGSQIEYLRKEQDRLLQRLANHWQLNSLDFTQTSTSYLGDPNRNQLFN